MSPPRPPAGVVALASLDVRRQPDHRSEMRSQLLTGEVVRVLGASPDRKWWKVRNRSDGYTGWVRTWGLVPATPRRAARWLMLARARVAAPIAELTAAPGAGTSVGPLFFSARVIPGRRSGRYRRVELPDGRRGWLRAAAIGAAPPRLADRVKSLLGSPYLWGGRTPAGFDCSGYVQQVLGERGIALPRDAWEQRSACRPLSGDEAPEEGDLLFFGAPRARVSHVGLALGGGYFTDCRGSVRIVSMESGNPLADNVLMAQFRGVCRPPAVARKRPRRG